MTKDIPDNGARIGFRATLKDPKGPEEPRRVGFGAEILDPEDRHNYEYGSFSSYPADAKTSFNNFASKINWRGIFTPAKMAVLGLGLLAEATIFAPEQVGHITGNFVGGFNDASAGHAICQSENTDCTIIRSIGEAVGTLTYNVQLGYAQGLYEVDTSESDNNILPLPITPP